MNTNLISYYSDRAAEYEKIYAKPERQPDLNEATQILQQLFQDKYILEIACGTGYWTERIAKTAASILAIDINRSVIEIAESKVYAPARVSFELADLFQMPIPAQPHESLFAGFIWSHIPLQEVDSFLEKIRQQIISGGILVFMDNNYVEGSNLPIANMDAHGNTYQSRRLENGAAYEVLKNFPDAAFIKNKLQQNATDIQLINLRHYWITVCKNK